MPPAKERRNSYLLIRTKCISIEEKDLYGASRRQTVSAAALADKRQEYGRNGQNKAAQGLTYAQTFRPIRIRRPPRRKTGTAQAIEAKSIQNNALEECSRILQSKKKA
jgi:hypothetical protein